MQMYFRPVSTNSKSCQHFKRCICIRPNACKFMRLCQAFLQCWYVDIHRRKLVETLGKINFQLLAYKVLEVPLPHAWLRHMFAQSVSWKVGSRRREGSFSGWPRQNLDWKKICCAERAMDLDCQTQRPDLHSLRGFIDVRNAKTAKEKKHFLFVQDERRSRTGRWHSSCTKTG